MYEIVTVYICVLVTMSIFLKVYITLFVDACIVFHHMSFNIVCVIMSVYECMCCVMLVSLCQYVYVYLSVYIHIRVNLGV